MKPVALDLNDRHVSVARDGQVLAGSPSTVFISDGTDSSGGGDAWPALRVRPTAISSRHLESVLARQGPDRDTRVLSEEMARRMAEFPLAADEELWLVAPAHAEAAGLSAILAVMRSLSVQVGGFVDSAAVTVAALGLERETLVLELGLHHVSATSVSVISGQTRRRRTVVNPCGGWIELLQLWLALAADMMVNQTRFDPLHTAATEQQLFDSIARLARDVAHSGTVVASVDHSAGHFEVELTRDQFAQAAAAVYRAATGLLHQIRPVGIPATLVIPGAMSALPGFRAELEQFVGCDLVVVPDAFAAAAASLLELPPDSERSASVPLLRRLAIQRRDLLLVSVVHEELGERRTGGPAPSHVALDGRTYALEPGALVIGREPGASRQVRLPDGLAGVSRRHCTLIREADEVALVDHSAFGTYVNGERVTERVRLYAGDRVRLGEPGVELALIAVGPDTPAAQH